MIVAAISAIATMPLVAASCYELVLFLLLLCCYYCHCCNLFASGASCGHWPGQPQ